MTDSNLKSALKQIGPVQLLSMLVFVSAFVAIVAGMWMWGQTADYNVLYSNLSDRDGGAIIESLQQQNIPYKFAEGGGALLVPSDKVHETRLRLASQGLPKGGTVGFELMENQKFGTSQFLEQVNYQRSLEGELARSVQTLGAVQTARVHLAIPKQTVFVKEQQKPTASVVVSLYPGRSLDAGQVNAIVHLISSSVPNMPAGGVTVVDQSGTLLSSLHEGGSDAALDATQLKYERQIEQDYIRRIEDIVAPLIGAQNVRAQVTADIDFTQAEQTAESFKPNLQTNQSSVRSTQIEESKNGVNSPAGVPGALSNQPPVPATAPIVLAASAVTGGSGESSSQHKEATTNYEVDRTIRYTKLPQSSIRRLSVAVLINNRTTTDSKGKAISIPFTPAELAQLNTLVKNAMGFNAQRGDSLNVLNSAFNETPEVIVPELPLWKQPDMIATAKTSLKYLLMGSVGLYLFFGIIRPAYRNLADSLSALEVKPVEVDYSHKEAQEKEFTERKSQASYESSVQAAKQMASQQPKIVASVLQEWVNR
ncbi:MAG: flagellar basal-body MS-ring/collar protein FliF [Gallionellaceae bacterium]|jgi:flagellar M-ring protein FliF